MTCPIYKPAHRNGPYSRINRRFPMQFRAICTVINGFTTVLRFLAIRRGSSSLRNNEAHSLRCAFENVGKRMPQAGARG